MNILCPQATIFFVIFVHGLLHPTETPKSAFMINLKLGSS